jgi:outer membrane protein OmpA-like peptidoglycan-associated protein
MRIKSLILIFVLALPISISAQQYVLSSKSKKAQKAYMKATEYYQANDLPFALIELEKATDTDPLFIEAWMLKGDIKEDQKKIEEAITCYQKAIDINPDFFPRNFYNLARMEITIGKYIESKEHYEAYLSYPDPNPNLMDKIKSDLNNCYFAIEAMKHPVPFAPINLGDSINSVYDEYSPTLTIDEQTMIVTLLRPSDGLTITGRPFEEDFYISLKNSDGTWGKKKELGTPLNSHGNEGCPSVSSDGKILYFTICNRSDGLGSCDIYYSERIGNSWSSPKNMGIKVNSSAWDTQPSISQDGNTLYFTSSRSGTKGTSDIWKTTKDEYGNWTTPVNLGDSINTDRDEQCPFIHPDGKTLYFCSNGRPGMGNYDIFYSRMDDNGNWSSAKNIGYPINSFDAEGFLFVNPQGNKAYFASAKYGGKGGMDIYSFDLYEEARPTAVTYMKGTVYDSKTKQRLQAKFELIDLSTSKTVAQSNSDAQSGEFMVSLPTDRNYALNVSRDGYLFHSENFELKGIHSQVKPYMKDILLQPIETGSIVVLKNIFFDFDKYDLLPESQVELNRLVDLLNKNSKMKIEIGGHTDNKGTKEYNQLLSQNRAKSVYDYLVQHSIDKTRLTYKGYGLTLPIDTNDTEEGRANNRRTEFKVIEF